MSVMEAESVSDVIADIIRWRDALADLPPARTESEAIDRITALEELTSAAAAAQARETLTFDMHRRNREAEDGVPSDKQGRGVGAEIGLARKVSRARGAKLVGFSRALLMDLPRTYAALSAGSISEEKARTVATESSWLPREKRQQLDERMSDRLAEVGVRRLGSEVRALAQKLDQVAAVKHLDHATTERCVSVRPAPGNMAYLTAFLPMPQAVAAYANLSKAAAARVGTGESNGCTQQQSVADLLVERITGQDSASAIPLEVLLVMNDETMFDDGDEPAWLPGFGSIPAGSAKSLISDNDSAVFLRRLYTRPSDGQLVKMDSNSREFTGLLRRMITVRDDVCRTPWCEATIRHVDHATPSAAGGATNWDNGSGLCAACNLLKELPGWRHRATATRLSVTTPTGHRYTVSTRPIDSRPGDARSACSTGEAPLSDTQARAPGRASDRPEGRASDYRAPGDRRPSQRAPEESSALSRPPGRHDPPATSSDDVDDQSVVGIDDQHGRTVVVLAETMSLPHDARIFIDGSMLSTCAQRHTASRASARPAPSAGGRRSADDPRSAKGSRPADSSRSAVGPRRQRIGNRSTRPQDTGDSLVEQRLRSELVALGEK